jgi:lipoyl-dependent peroxiredoxin
LPHRHRKGVTRARAGLSSGDQGTLVVDAMPVGVFRSHTREHRQSQREDEMPTRNASAEWKGDLKGGSGRMALGSGAWEGAYSFGTRFEEAPGTNPEELIAAAHAGCFSMALANMLAQAGHPAESVRTQARVHLEPGQDGPSITRIELECRASVPGIDAGEFRQHAEAAKTGCPVSKVLKAAEITLDAALE